MGAWTEFMISFNQWIISIIEFDWDLSTKMMSQEWDRNGSEAHGEYNHGKHGPYKLAHKYSYVFQIDMIIHIRMALGYGILV